MKKEDIIIGTEVIYWAVLRSDGTRTLPFKSVITSEPWELGHGELVCKIAGKSGGIAISHLEPVTLTNLIPAIERGLKFAPDPYQPLFDLLYNDHNITALKIEMREIMLAVDEVKANLANPNFYDQETAPCT